MNRHAGHNHEYRIWNAWTMKASGTYVMSAPGDGAGGGDDGADSLARDDRYFEQGQFERMRKLLDEKRGRWVETFMGLVIAETREFFQSQKTLTRKFDDVLADDAPATEERVTTTGEELVNMESDAMTSDMDDESEVVELMLNDERVRMETLLVHEVDEWEGKLWNMAQGFICREDVPEKEKLQEETRCQYSGDGCKDGSCKSKCQRSQQPLGSFRCIADEARVSSENLAICCGSV
jgi:hypothetical protein